MVCATVRPLFVRVIAPGSPKDLAEKNGVYAHMVKLQTESQNWKLA